MLEAQAELPPLEDLEVPSRIVHLPLSWDDPATQLAIEKYTQSVRTDAPWCPSNIEFIRRINGLDSIEDVRAHRVRGELSRDGAWRRLSRRAGGDAARSAAPPGHHQVQPCAHLDAGERRRASAVRICCIYGMEGPGGYQFVGRTVQMWNRLPADRGFPRRPAVARCGSSIRSGSIRCRRASCLTMREGFPRAWFPLRVEAPPRCGSAISEASCGRRRRSICCFQGAAAGRAFERSDERWKRSGAVVAEADGSRLLGGRRARRCQEGLRGRGVAR